MSKLLSVSILFRHGARGPGDSETSAWEESDAVVSQWEEHECENLSTIGSEMLKDLGTWFARKYVLDGKLIEKPAAYFRGSKSDRAVDSGRDFVGAFNAALGFECSPTIPMPFAENPDAYFRPWKVHTESSKTVKLKMKNEDWTAKAEENKEFLARLRQQLAMKADYGENLSKALWSITHVAGLIECETYWPTNDRTALSHRVKPEDFPKIAELSSWVWRERFLESGFEHLLGGWIFLEMIQRTFDCEGSDGFTGYNMNIFSAHDYTILALLAIDEVIFKPEQLRGPIEFGSYIIFELWENEEQKPIESNEITVQSIVDTLHSCVTVFADAIQASVCDRSPAPDAAANADATTSTDAAAALAPAMEVDEAVSSTSNSKRSNRTLRIVLNQRAFARRTDLFGLDAPRSSDSVALVDTVRDDRAVVLVELTMQQVREIVEKVVTSLSVVPHGLPSHFQMPQFE